MAPDLIYALDSELGRLGLLLPATQRNQLIRYLESLKLWDRTINLTALDGAPLVRRLIAEPLWVFEQLNPAGRYLDIGSGNGSPAIPWTIRRSFKAVDLVEARTRRAVFLRQTVREIGLDGVPVHRGRFESLAEGLGPEDWITLQGVGLSTTLLEGIHLCFRERGTLVWFTRNARSPVAPTRILDIPMSDRQALVFEV